MLNSYPENRLARLEQRLFHADLIEDRAELIAAIAVLSKVVNSNQARCKTCLQDCLMCAHFHVK